MARGIIKTMLLYYFVDADPRFETFEKEETTGKGGIDFEMVDWDIFAHLH